MEIRKLIKDLKWKFYMFKLNISVDRIEAREKRNRIKYCRKGYHKLGSWSVSIKEPGKRTKCIRYLKCYHCEYLFFASELDKERYKEIKREDNEQQQSWLKAIVSTQT